MAVTKDKLKSADGLKGRLEDYSASARAGATKSTLRQRLGNWPVYAAATGSAMAMAANASAAGIIYSGVLNKNLASSVAARGSRASSEQLGIAPKLYFDLLHNPTARYASIGAGFNGSQTSGAKELDVSNRGVLKDLPPGAIISAGAAGFFGSHETVKHKSVNGTGMVVVDGNWAAGVPGFEGFRFATGLGQFDYGWAELQIGLDGSGYPDSVTLLGMAYDSSGASIAAGELPAQTPEPGAAGLMLLALGAAGVTLLRKRKI